MTISGDAIRPGDVYEYRCDNDQGYGYMIPVKTTDTAHGGGETR